MVDTQMAFAPKKKFRIDYLDPEWDGEGDEPWLERECAFSDTGSVTAKEWADDLAYSLADKGPCKVTAI